MRKETKEAWLRIPIGIISGIIIGFWGELIGLIAVFHFFKVLFTGKRSRSLAQFSNIWVSQAFTYTRYMSFVANNRPFPFHDLAKDVKGVELKK